jgi:hypothetical protein
LSASPSILEDRLVHLHLLTRYEAELQARGTKNTLPDSHLISLALVPAPLIYRDIIASSFIELETPNISQISPLSQCPTHPHSQLNNITTSNLNTLHRPTSLKLRCKPSDKASRAPITRDGALIRGRINAPVRLVSSSLPPQPPITVYRMQSNVTPN